MHDHKPIALRKAKIVCDLDFLSAIRLILMLKFNG